MNDIDHLSVYHCGVVPYLMKSQYGGWTGSGALFVVARCVSKAVMDRKSQFVAKCSPVDGVGQLVGYNQP
jgi:hypothetical protein